VLAALDGALREKVDRNELTGALFCYAPAEAVRHWQRLRPELTPLPARPGTVVNLVGTCLSDHLDRIQTRRRECQREIRRFADADYKTSVEPLSAVYGEVVDLMLALEASHGNHPSRANVQTSVRRQAQEMGTDAVVFGARAAGRLVGMALCCRWRDQLHVRSVGFDYSALRGAFEYFNLAYYLPIDFAYRHGLRQVYFGTGTYEAKLRRGATTLARFHAVLHGPQPPREAAMAVAGHVADAFGLATDQVLGPGRGRTVGMGWPYGEW
jgi:hypothetical protein